MDADALYLGMINGMPIKESPMAMERVPAKKHRVSIGMKKSYHHRIQKKWNKRYGYTYQPCAYILNNQVIVAHPDVIKALRQTR